MTEPRYLEGPAFIAWLTSEGIKRSDLPRDIQRSHRRWQAGDRVDFYGPACDRILTDHGLASLIPDRLWSIHQKRSGNTRRKVLA